MHDGAALDQRRDDLGVGVEIVTLDSFRRLISFAITFCREEEITDVIQPVLPCSWDEREDESGGGNLPRSLRASEKEQPSHEVEHGQRTQEHLVD